MIYTFNINYIDSNEIIYQVELNFIENNNRIAN